MLPSTDTLKIPPVEHVRVAPELIAIGASAGGPSALISLLNGLPTDFSLPIAVVQHIPSEFTNGLARWLRKSTPLNIEVASDGLKLQPSHVIISPGWAHLTIVRQRQGLTARLIKEQGTSRYQPSVDVLFSSVAVISGAASIGIILTGMGDDGAEGLLAMRRAGARTYAQDEASSTVFGMPGAAIERGGVEQVLPLTKLATVIRNLM
jgi:two-component system chemotaxis response regulator CheB